MKLNLNERPQVVWAGPALYRGPSENTFKMGDLFTAHLFQYEGVFLCNGVKYPIRPGVLTISPPFSKLEFEYPGPSCFLYSFHFQLSKAKKGKVYEAPEYLEYKLEDMVSQQFVRASEAFSIDSLKCEIGLWNLLLEVSKESSDSDDQGRNSLVEQAIQFIHGNLSESIQSGDIANKVNVTPTHLARLFKAEVEMGVIEYLRHQRIKKAENLLSYTNLPIKVISDQVGIPDLQYFNKTFRAFTGKSPRAYRQALG